jgi:hypothetical protein
MSSFTDTGFDSVFGVFPGAKMDRRRPLDVTALRQACQGSMAKVLGGDLQSHTVLEILVAMHTVQLADNALDQLIAQYLEMQDTKPAQRPRQVVGRLVTCAANFLLEEFNTAGSTHGASNWNLSCVSELNRLGNLVASTDSAKSIHVLQNEVVRHCQNKKEISALIAE